MTSIDRRQFLETSALGAAGLAAWELSARRSQANNAAKLQLATFQFDVTPPIGHSCCGGWIKPVEAVDDPLEAIGLVILGSGKPIVLCAVDWTGILNEAHGQWREALAEAAGTTADRVAVQCVHQHNAPFACLESEQMVAAQGDLPHILDVDFFRRCLDQGRKAVAEGISQAQNVTHVAHGQGKVDKVASNRRVSIGADGKIDAMRGSACKDQRLIDLPEGLIDPWLRTVAFYNGDKKIAACHYYATHPMSYYGDGRVSSDFAGLARKQRQADEPDCRHIYFTGCAGNIAAGKYNDGSPPLRAILTKRIYDGIVASEKDLQPEPIGLMRWDTQTVLPTPRTEPTAEELQQQIVNKQNPVVGRNRPAYQLAWLQRLQKQIPIVISALHLNNVSMLHLPSECFIEYQLRAQELRPNRFVATAAYGDGGPWYIPTKEAFPQGGYEVGVAFCEPEFDDVLSSSIQSVLQT